MQDAGPIGLDGCRYLDWPTRLIDLYLFFSLLGLFLIVIRNWEILGFRSNSLKQKLLGFDRLCREQNWIALRALTLRFRPNSPAAGLRQLSTTGEPPELVRLLGDSDRYFKVAADNFQWHLNNLSRWRKVTAFVLGGYTTLMLANIFSKIALEKAVGLSGVAGGFAELLLVLTSGYFLLVVLLLVQWHFASRMRKHAALWNEFITHAKTNLLGGINHEQ